MMYRGRFAPTPSGPLHFGSLLAAVGSYWAARASGGTWLLRIDDLDRPRVVPGAADGILRTLESFGFQWDGPVAYQSQHQEIYLQAFLDLQEAELIYPCGCSRRQLDGYTIYPGTCRRSPPTRGQQAWRASVPSTPLTFHDTWLGPQEQNLAAEVGDFVVRRRDGLFAYQLAVVVDDHAAGVTHVVRGADLLDNTARQIWLHQCLGLDIPEYGHLPVAVNQRGQKLSKQTCAPALDTTQANRLLCAALAALGWETPAGLDQENVATIWRWALNTGPRDGGSARGAVVIPDGAFKASSGEDRPAND